MAHSGLVIGGWGAGPDLLRPLFDDSAEYADVNQLMPSLVQGETLRENWIDVVERRYARKAENALFIAGWSTGAIVALALAQRIAPRKLVLLSATPSFCRRAGFRFGWKPGVIGTMIERLYVPGNTVAADFAAAAGIKNADAAHDGGTLAAGLRFLEQANLLPSLAKAGFPAFVLHGQEDAIVPLRAGEMLAAALGARFCPCPGGHVFFDKIDKHTMEQVLE